MLLLNNTTESQSVAVQRELKEEGTPTSLHIRGTVSLKAYDIDVSFLTKSENGRYYFIDLSLPSKMPEGSYEYELKAGDVVLASGCARIGNYSPEDFQYEKTIEYKQYGE